MKYWCIKQADPSPDMEGTHQHRWVADDGHSEYLTICDENGHTINPFVKRGVSVLQDLRAVAGPAATIEEVSLAPGAYHPRIFRPSGGVMLEAPDFYQREWLSSLQAVRNLLAVMDNVFRYLEPHPKNSEAFGHELRQLLILGCTEVESSWKAVLKANGYVPPTTGRFTTNDYFKLAAPMRLREWEVRLTFHPDYPPFKPFEKWSATNPTQSLTWYDAYNAVKHDREANFQLATLENAILAIGAAYLMVPAQFGLFHNFLAGMRDPFYVMEPNWPPSEYYIPP